MAEAQLCGMEKVARVPGKRARARQRSAACAIEGISHERVARSGQVDADLMGTARGYMDVAKEFSRRSRTVTRDSAGFPSCVAA